MPTQLPADQLVQMKIEEDIDRLLKQQPYIDQNSLNGIYNSEIEQTWNMIL
jgi:hypothetical protein